MWKVAQTFLDAATIAKVGQGRGCICPLIPVSSPLPLRSAPLRHTLPAPSPCFARVTRDMPCTACPRCVQVRFVDDNSALLEDMT
jgi:hypothetical protein